MTRCQAPACRCTTRRPARPQSSTRCRCSEPPSAATGAPRFTAPDAKAAQRALDARAEAGFHGDAGGGKDYAFEDDSGAKAGKVKSLTVSGFHNSCPGCVRSFREAIKGVAGVAGDTAMSRVRTCEVAGDFDAAELVKALNKAGFHVKVKP